MPTLANNWRQRKIAIGKKGELETEMLWDSEVLKPKPNDEIISKPASPVSVASSFAAEMQPFVLPGAWTVVGKKGKPVKGKMYDEPQVQVKKKKSKKKARKAPTDDDDLPLVALEEAPSSSKCLHALDRSTAARNKVVHRSLDAKFWSTYQQKKELKREALTTLLASLEIDGALDKDDKTTQSKIAQSKPAFSCKANAAKDKARRRARSAAADAKCFSYDADEDADAGLGRSGATEQAPQGTQMRGELELCFDGNGQDVNPTEVKLPGAWTKVGKRGKAMPDFPPLKPSVIKQPTLKQTASDAGLKRRASSEPASSSAEQQQVAPKREKTGCLLM